MKTLIRKFIAAPPDERWRRLGFFLKSKLPAGPRARRQQARCALSMAAWDRLAADAYRLYRTAHTDPAEIETTGLVVRRLSPERTEQFQQAYFTCPPVLFRCRDHAADYNFDNRRSKERSFNRWLIHHRATSEMRWALSAFLTAERVSIEHICGHFWAVSSFRLFAQKPGSPDSGIGFHVDGWPVSMKKLFILPWGADAVKGSTAFRLKTGEERVVEGGPGTWFIFENSRIHHSLVAPTVGLRYTIEINIVPALRTDPTLVDAGMNGNFPWFPPQPYDLDLFVVAASNAGGNAPRPPAFIEERRPPRRASRRPASR